MQGGAIPANIEQLFPVWNDISTWNLNALSPIARFYSLAVGDFESNNPVTSLAGWAQDDWTLGRLTLNLGVRYDIIKGTYGEERGFDPWLAPNRPLDKNNIQPRLGFAYGINDRTRDARRLGAVLWRRHRRGPRLLHGNADHQRPGQQRRAAGLREQPVQRPDSDLRAGRQERRAAIALPHAAL